MKPYTRYFLTKVAIFVVCGVGMGVYLSNGLTGLAFGLFAATLFELMFKERMTSK